jgi:hypothetical protein
LWFNAAGQDFRDLLSRAGAVAIAGHARDPEENSSVHSSGFAAGVLADRPDIRVVDLLRAEDFVVDLNACACILSNRKF